MVNRILLVDDEENVLHGYHRVMRKAFDMELAMGGGEALQILEERGPFAVIVADMRMPGMSGLDLLETVKSRYPDTIRIMLTGNSDQKTAMDAVNHGQVFRFLAKPCPPEELELALQAGLRQYQLVVSEKELLEQTLTGAITLFSELLAGVDPVMFSRSQVVRRRSAQLARKLGCGEIWAIEIAALLAPIGRITLPGDVLRDAQGSASAAALLAALPEVGARLLQPIPRMEGIAQMIRYQAKGYDGSGMPADEVQGEAIPMGARILRALWDFSELETARRSRVVALEELKLRPKAYDPKVLSALSDLLASPPAVRALQDFPVGGLQPGMVLASDIRTEQGRLVLPTGLRLGPGHLELLAGLARLMELQEPVSVLDPEGGLHEA